MNELPLVIVTMPGEPVAKERARFTPIPIKRKGGGLSFAFPARKTKTYETNLGFYANRAMRGIAPLTIPLRVVVTITLSIPESWGASKRTSALAGYTQPTSKPDGDNYYKAVADALNKIVWADDALIVDLRCIKRYGAEPSIRIEVYAKEWTE